LARGLVMTVDKILFAITVVLSITLFVIIWCWWRRRRQTVHTATGSSDLKEPSGVTLQEKAPVKYPIITVTKTVTDSEGASVASEVSSMWDSQSQKVDQTYFSNQEIGNQLRKSFDMERGKEDNEVNEIYDGAEVGSCASEAGSSFERVDQSRPPMKMLQKQMHIYSKSDIEAVESRDDDAYIQARSI